MLMAEWRFPRQSAMRSAQARLTRRVVDARCIPLELLRGLFDLRVDLCGEAGEWVRCERGLNIVAIASGRLSQRRSLRRGVALAAAAGALHGEGEIV
jgi:hypothetical protein